MIFWFSNIASISLLTFLMYRKVRNELSALVFFSSLILRLIAGITAGLLFFKLYPGGDSTSFYNFSIAALDEGPIWSILTGDFNPQGYANQPRVVFFIQILSVALVLSGGSYWIASLYFAFLSFAASIYFVIQFSRLFADHRAIAITFFLFLPSVLFWSSGILKDTVSYSAFVVVVIQVLKFHENARFDKVEYILGIISLFVLFKIKHYLLITSLLYAGMLLSLHWFRKLNGLKRWVVSIISLALFFTLTQFVHPYLTINRIPQTIYDNNKTIAERTSPEKQVDIVINQPDWKSVISETPNALFTGLFRPSIFDKTPIWGFIHKIENFVLTSLLFFSILILVSQKSAVNWRLVLPSILCIMMLATLLALTTPNLGTLVRYKNAFFPFLFLLVSVLPFQYLTSKSSS